MRKIIRADVEEKFFGLFASAKPTGRTGARDNNNNKKLRK